MNTIVVVVIGAAIAGGCKKKSDDGGPPAPITATAKPREHAVGIHMTGVRPGTDVTIEGIDTQKLRTERGGSINNPTFDIDVDWSAIPATKQELTIVVTEKMSPTKSVESKTTIKLERPLTMTLTERSHSRKSGLSCTGEGLMTANGLAMQTWFPSVDPNGELVFGLAAPVAGKLEADGKTHDVEPGKPIVIKHNVLTAALDKAIADKTPIPVLRAKLTTGGRTAEARVSCTVISLPEVLVSAWDQPLLAPGETVGPAVAMLSSAGFTGELGKAKIGRDYHLLARSFELPDLKRPCGTYVNRATGTTKALENRATRVEVRVKDRRTGQEVAKKEFSGTIPPCAKKVAGQTGDVGVPNKAAIDAWLGSILAARSKT